MEAPESGGLLEKVLIPLVIAITGWVIALFGYIYHQGMQSQKIESLKETVDKDERTFTEAIKELKDAFIDSNGNSRLMPTAVCLSNRDGCKDRFTNVEKRFDTFEGKMDKRDNEMFDRIRSIENTTTEMSMILRMLKTYPRPLTEEERPKKTIETFFSRSENEEAQ